MTWWSRLAAGASTGPGRACLARAQPAAARPRRGWPGRAAPAAGVVLLGAALLPGAVRAQSVATDRAALVALYDATAGASWTTSTNWKTSAALNQWHGVTTDANGRVTGLQLDNNNLDGMLPTALGDLSALATLSLSTNAALRGSIPKELGNLSSLTSLHIAIAKLSGSIPKELGNLSNLTSLQIYRNELSGSIPKELGNLSNLTRLDLSTNKLSGAIPKELGNLSNLIGLNLYVNELSGAIPKELGNLTLLTGLLAHNNKLSGTIPKELGNLTRLLSLYLNNNELSGAIPAELGDLSSLRAVTLQENDLSGAIPGALGKLSNLTVLGLYNNELSGPIPADLGKLSSLTHLYAYGNRLSGPIPAELGDLSSLRELILNGNRLWGPVPSELGGLSNLTHLYLYHNQLTGKLPQSLVNVTGMQVFYWTGNAGLCAPRNAAFQTWLAAVPAKGGPTCPPPKVTLEVWPNPLPEGETATVTAAIRGTTAAATTVTVQVAAQIGTDGADFALHNATIEIPAGDDPVGGAKATIIALADDDHRDEGLVVSAAVVNTTEQVDEPEPVRLVIEDPGMVAPAPETVANRPPAFVRSTFVFDLPEHRDGRRRPVALGHVTAEDPDGDALTYELLSGDRERFVLGTEDAALAYVGPGEDYETEPNRFELTARVLDGRGAHAVAPVVVRVVGVNEWPRAEDDETWTREDEPLTVDVLANDTDPDGDRLHVERVSGAAHGTTTIAGGGVAYAPKANWHGRDHFTYVASDGQGGTASAAVTVTVLPVNDAPAAVGTMPDRTLDEGGEAARVELTPFFTDVDGDALTYRAEVSDAAVAEATVAGAWLTLTAMGPGAARVTVTAEDAGGLTAVQGFAVGVSDRLVRAVLNDAMAGMARSHLASARMMLGRRMTARGGERPRLTVAGRGVPLGRAEAVRALRQLASGWLARLRGPSAGPWRGAGAAGAWDGTGAAGGGGPGARSGLGLGPLGGGGLGPLGGGSLGPGPLGPGGLVGNGPSFGGLDRGALGDGFGLGGFSGGPDTWLRGTDFLLGFGGGAHEDRDPDDHRGGDRGAAGAAPAGRRWTVWGQGDVQTFAGAPSEATGYDGALRTGWLGVDADLTARWRAGVALSRSDGDGAWRVGGAHGTLATTLTAAHPWVQWSDGATSVGASVGGGWGAAENVRRNGRAERSRLGLQQGLAEVRRRLGAGGGGDFGVRADAAWARLVTAAGGETVAGQTAEVRQARVGVDAALALRLGGLGLTPFGELHLRRDGGAGETGAGMEVVAGVRAAGGRVRLDAQGRLLVLHSTAGYREQGVGVTLAVGAPQADGLSLTLTPRWGDSAAAAAGGALWQDTLRRRFHPDAAGEAWAVDARADYGMRLPGGARLAWFGSWTRALHGSGFRVGARVGD